MTDERPCERFGYRRVTVHRAPVTGSVDGFRLDADPDTLVPGESITFSLLNTADGIREVGSRSTYAFQRGVSDEESETDWQDIMYRPDTAGHRLILGRFSPGVIYTWTCTLTAERQLESEADDSHLGYICPALTPDTYRFVYRSAHTSDGLPAVELSVE